MRIDSLKDFLEVQKQYSELIIALYTRRKLEPVSFREAVELCGGDEKGEAKLLSFLNSRRLGIETDSGIILDPTLRQSYERIMHTNTTINDDVIARIRPDVERICEEWDECENAQDKQVIVTELYQTLEQIPDGLEHSISDLARFTEEQYKAAISFRLKRAKLESLAKQARQIQRLLDESHKLLSDDSHKLRTVILRDPEVDTSLIPHILNRAKVQLVLSSKALIAVTSRLQEYISKVERASRVAKRAHLLAKKIYDGTINAETNFLEALEVYDDIGIKGETYIMVDKYDIPSIAECGLYGDKLADIASDKLVATDTKRVSPAIDIEEETSTLSQESSFYRPDYKVFFRSFMAQGIDLFSYIMGFEFPEDVSILQRLELYLYFCSAPEYGTSLDFAPGEYGTYTYTTERTGEPVTLEYQIVNAH